MDENRELSERELGDVSGGATGPSFSRLVEEFARKNKCSDCRQKNVYRNHEMCIEVYDQLLLSYTLGDAIGMRCTRRI